MNTLNINKGKDDLNINSILEKNRIDDPNLTVCFVPKLPSTNPYQSLLEQSLSNLDVQVHGIDPYKFFLPTATKKYKPNVIHIHWLEPYLKAKSTYRSLIKVIGFVLGLLILKFKKNKIVWTVHNLKCHETYSNPLLQLLDYILNWSVAKVSDSMIVHSYFAKEEVESRFGVDHKKIVVIDHGNYIDYYENSISKSDARRLLGIPSSDFCYLFLGNIRPYKGVVQLVKAFNELERQDSTLVIAGSPITINISDKILKEANNNPKIILHLKHILDEEIQIYMNACDVIVFPYHSILTSGALILAMSFGKVCIAPKISCIPELLDESQAFLYKPDSNQGLLSAMIQARKDQSSIHTMGNHSLGVATNMDWKSVAQKTVDTYYASV
ncbi:glycosyltransferase [Acaryochloris sp. IP29b_bin.137]|uniref:glycosyltransferase n=1 Tax=Acaryochloris sp. IP29b_bin.137 TaxID=2969217 RepID=UPI00261841BC|nr:glycosyltransferase [Acaryochloris sp. IP29b_bin.137]